MKPLPLSAWSISLLAAVLLPAGSAEAQWRGRAVVEDGWFYDGPVVEVPRPPGMVGPPPRRLRYEPYDRFGNPIFPDHGYDRDVPNAPVYAVPRPKHPRVVLPRQLRPADPAEPAVVPGIAPDQPQLRARAAPDAAAGDPNREAALGAPDEQAVPVPGRDPGVKPLPAVKPRAKPNAGRKPVVAARPDAPPGQGLDAGPAGPVPPAAGSKAIPADRPALAGKPPLPAAPDAADRPEAAKPDVATLGPSKPDQSSADAPAPGPVNRGIDKPAESTRPLPDAKAAPADPVVAARPTDETAKPPASPPTAQSKPASPRIIPIGKPPEGQAKLVVPAPGASTESMDFAPAKPAVKPSQP